MPMTKSPATTKFPNASITEPAAPVPRCPSIKISRVLEMLSPSRRIVSSSKSDGYTLNSTGLSRYIVETSVMTESVMLREISTSSTKAGTGMTIIRTTPMIATGTAASSISIMGVVTVLLLLISRLNVFGAQSSLLWASLPLGADAPVSGEGSPSGPASRWRPRTGRLSYREEAS